MLRITRAALHELVWSKPMTEIARQFDVRDVRVAQACDALDIARPRPGHWQRIAYGKQVETVPLDNSEYPSDQVVTIEEEGWRECVSLAANTPSAERGNSVERTHSVALRSGPNRSDSAGPEQGN